MRPRGSGVHFRPAGVDFCLASSIKDPHTTVLSTQLSRNYPRGCLSILTEGGNRALTNRMSGHVLNSNGEVLSSLRKTIFTLS